MEEKNKNSTYDIKSLFILFFIYSFIGWIIEVLLEYIFNGIWANRGFLHAPILPIFGMGGLLVTLAVPKFEKEGSNSNIFLDLAKSFILTFSLEYILSYLQELIFHTRWWDYSNEFLNINGRVCLKYSLLFAVSGYIIAKFISPKLNLLIHKINKEFLNIILIFLVILLITDIGISFVYPNMGLGVTISIPKSIILKN